MRFTFFCPKISAFFQKGPYTELAEIAAGVFSTVDDQLATFLKGYPGVTCLREEVERPAAPNPGQHGPVPEQPPVVNGGFSGGGMAGVRIKKQ
jgi:hypothetical protein